MLFSKMHGAGNDYIFVNCINEEPRNEGHGIGDPQAVARFVSDRHFGIGGDGLVLICPSEKADAAMRMYNADGSEGAMCGNAIRCVGKYLYDNRIVTKSEVTVETASGIKRLILGIGDDKVRTVTVNMGAPVFEPWLIPMEVGGTRFIDRPVRVGGCAMRATALSMGNPHWVFFVEDPDRLDLAATGPLFEWYGLFPKRVNTEFVAVEGDRLRMRVWERGSGETLACGTGACAAAVAACVCGRCRRRVTVTLRGGELEVNWDEATGDVFLSGGATHVFD
ncbi:MAG: diaminopimelate epimerase, partial [Acetanaerobacterium sp.]